MIDLSALNQVPAAAQAAQIFTAALGYTPGRLTPLALPNNALVDVRVTLIDDITAPHGITRLVYRDDNEVIAGDSGGIDHVAPTYADVQRRGLVFQIALNVARIQTAGQILQTLRHEYGGHASPWGGYLAPLVAPALPPGNHEADLAEAMGGKLWGGIQHLKMFEEKAIYYRVLGSCIEQIFAANPQLKQMQDEYLADVIADRASLQALVATSRDLLLATTEADVSEKDLVELVIPNAVKGPFNAPADWTKGQDGQVGTPGGQGAFKKPKDSTQ